MTHYLLRIRDVGPRDSRFRRLRWLLKYLLRRFDFRCEAIERAEGRE
jgi:hypothetical protein